MAVLLTSLKAFQASTKLNPSLSSVFISFYNYLDQWISPSISDSSPAYRLWVPQASVTFCFVPKRLILQNNLLQISLIPSGWMPGSLSRATCLLCMNSQFAAQGILPLDIQLTKWATACLRCMLTLTVADRSCWMADAFVPSSPTPPYNWPLSHLTISSVIAALDMTGVQWHFPRDCFVASLTWGYFCWRDSTIVISTSFPFILYFLESFWLDCKSPPDSLQVMYLIAALAFPLV